MKKEDERRRKERERFRLENESLRSKNYQKLQGDDASEINSFIDQKSKQGGHVPTRKHVLDSKRREQELKVEELLTNKKLNFQDLQKLNYKQINKVSQKLKEDTFNPKDILDMIADTESEEEILQKFHKGRK